MAVAFRAAGAWSFTPNNVATPATLTPGAPAGKAVGDALVLVCESRSITATVATPSGWTLLTGYPKRSATASGGTIYVFTRVADGTASDTPSPVWSGLTTGTTGDASGAGILAWSGCQIATDGTPAVSDLSAQTTTSVIPAETTGTAGSLVVGIALKLLESSAQTSTVATFTERADNSTTSGTGHIIAVSDKIVSPAGSSGTATVTWSATTSARALTTSFGLLAAVAVATGDAAITLASPAVTAAGSVLVQGSGSGSLAPVASAAGAVLVQGVSSATIAGPSASGAGTVASAGVNGDASIALSGPSATATGTVLIQGASSIVLATPSVSGSATHPVQGASTAQLATPAATSTGTVLVQGSSTISLTLALSASGGVLVQGAGLGHLAVTATGTGTIGSFIAGDGLLMLSLAATAAGAVLVQGAGSPTLTVTARGDGSALVADRVIVTGPQMSPSFESGQPRHGGNFSARW